MNRAQRSDAPVSFKKSCLGSQRQLVYISSNVQICHLHRINWRSLRLLGSRILQADSSGSHVPEVAAVEILLGGVVVKDRRKRCVSVSLRFSTTYSSVRPYSAGAGVEDRNGSWVSRGSCIEKTRASSEARVGFMAS